MRFFNFIALIFITLNVSCNKSSLKKIDLIDYTMDIPNDWSILNIEAIDSESIVLLTKKKDTILCLYGDYKNQFDETNKVFSNDSRSRGFAIRALNNNIRAGYEVSSLFFN
jgi:hypothetical protein